MRTRRLAKCHSGRLASRLMTSSQLAPLILGYCGEARCACRLRVGLGKQFGLALRRILLSGVLNDLLEAEKTMSGCSLRGFAYLHQQWKGELAPDRERGLRRWLMSGVRGHGSARVRSSWVEANETVSLISLPIFTERSRRVVFSVCASDENLCDPGCWCTGKATQSVSCFLPKAVEGRRRDFSWRRGERKKRTIFTPLLAFASRYGRGALRGPPSAWAARSASCDQVADALGISPEDLGFVVKFLFIVGNDKGHKRWSRLEKLHYIGLSREEMYRDWARRARQRAQNDDDDDDDENDEDQVGIENLVFNDDEILLAITSDDAESISSSSSSASSSSSSRDSSSSDDDGEEASSDGDIFDNNEDDSSGDESSHDDDSEDDSDHDDDDSILSSLHGNEEALVVRDFPQLHGTDTSSKLDLLHAWDDGGITPRLLLKRTADKLEYDLPEKCSSDITRLVASLSNWADATLQLLQEDDEAAAVCFSALPSSRRHGGFFYI